MVAWSVNFLRSGCSNLLATGDTALWSAASDAQAFNFTGSSDPCRAKESDCERGRQL